MKNENHPPTARIRLLHTPVHELPARVALHGEGDHHADANLLLGITLQTRNFLGVEIRREVLAEHLSFTHGERSVLSSLEGRKRPELLVLKWVGSG